LTGIILLASLRNDNSIYGLWFYVPVTGAIVFSYLTLFFLEESVSENNPKKIYLTALFLFLIAFIHQSSFLVIFLTTAVFFIFNYKFVIKQYKYFLPFLILLIPAKIVIEKMPGGFSLNHFIWGPAPLQASYNPILFYGVLLSIFALAGYYFAFREKKLISFRIYVLIPLINLYLFPFTNFTIFSAYERYMMHFMLAMVPLSAVGFFKLISIVNNNINKLKKFLRIKIATDLFRYIVIIGVFVVCFFVIFYNYYNIHPNKKLYHIIEDKDYEAMLFLRDYGEPSRAIRLHPTQAEVLVERFPGIALPPIAEKASILTDPLAASSKEYSVIHKFFDGDCSEKQEVISNAYYGNLKYAYSYEEMDCDFLEEIYNKDGIYIYKIIKEKINN